MRTLGRSGQVLVGLGLLLAPLAAVAQPAGKVYRVGVLGVGQMRPEHAPVWEAFRAGLRDHGYLEGRNLALEFRWAEGKSERLPALAAELIGLPVDVLVVVLDQTAVVAKAATRTTPVVFIAGDPVRRGLVTSLARPGGNLTGLTWDAGPDVWAKSFELLKEAVPGMSLVAYLGSVADPADPDNPASLAYRTARESAARQLKLALHDAVMRRPEELAAGP